MKDDLSPGMVALYEHALGKQHTGWPPGLLQDDCAALSKWLASRPDARRRALATPTGLGRAGTVRAAALPTAGAARTATPCAAPGTRTTRAATLAHKSLVKGLLQRTGNRAIVIHEIFGHVLLRSAAAVGAHAIPVHAPLLEASGPSPLVVPTKYQSSIRLPPRR